MILLNFYTAQKSLEFNKIYKAKLGPFYRAKYNVVDQLASFSNKLFYLSFINIIFKENYIASLHYT